MHNTLRHTLALALLAGGVVSVQAADAPYYNPTNTASKTGYTTDYEQTHTIGCPGKQLLEGGCKGPLPAKPAPAPLPPADGDKDGVIDGVDKCPNTPTGRKVDALGCELDGDKDGVVDGIDQCPATPPGRKVDAKGCEFDGDKDGVVDGIDECPNTPAGRKVDAKGCEFDGDKDGVVDGIDECPNTPAGRKVNAKGCEFDGDKDGIVDGIDLCPNTPAGDKVDANGCTLLNTIILKGVNFDNDSAVLRPDSSATLDEAIATLKRYPGIKVEIAGHTDHTSSDSYNQKLSERRAQSVMAYFTSKGIPADSLTAKGYGESKPIADNATEEGRGQNRRVEMRIQ